VTSAPQADTRLVLPPYAQGMRIGLFGGTFDPPHEAHLAACLLAMKKLGLDRVWWLVTPGNPLKDKKELTPLADRIRAIKDFARDPRIVVTGFEEAIGSHYTFQTVSFLRRRCPGVRFVWIMGADNLRSFHRWQNWKGIARMIPIAVVDRLVPDLSATGGIAAQALGRWRVPESGVKTLPDRRPPAWAYLHGLKSGLSSTALRRKAQHKA
jgi:nicotinate-nucleotide adenylyltransferase